MSGQLYFLDTNLSAFPNHSGRILRCNVDGSDLQEIVTGMKYLPDGIIIDEENGHVYWTNMGANMSNPNDGSIQRCDLDGSNIVDIVPPGSGLHTPKQLTIARPANGRPKLYWCDREGMKVMRSNFDGSDIEILVQTGFTAEDRADKRNWCVGITVDSQAGMMYWTQKGPSKGGVGRIFRAPVEKKAGEKPHERTDIELLLDNQPEPIDLHIDVAKQILYWTDRGDPPTGNTVNCAKVDGVRDAAGKLNIERKILTRKAHETIGLAVDEDAGKMYYCDLLGGVYSANVDGSEKKTLFVDVGDCTGLAWHPTA